MKFLGGIHKFAIEDDKIRFKIPFYHRTALGLLSSGVKIYSLPKKTVKNGIEVKEIILSPFKPNDWEHLWKMELSMEDRPGLLRDVTEIISNNHINISIQESSIESYNKDFSITLFIDCRSFFEKHKFHGKSIDDRRDKLKVKLLEDYRKKGYLNFEINRLEPVEFLRANCPKNISDSENTINANILNEYNDIDKFLEVEENGMIVMKQSILKDLGILNGKTTRVLEGTTFSDTEEKYAILRFFDPEQYVINIDVVHNDRVGMISSFTKKIMDIDPKFNIINGYNRIENYNHIAHWYALLDISSNPDKIKRLVNKLNAGDFEVQEVRILNYTNNIEKLYADIPDSLEIYKKKQSAQKSQEEKHQMANFINSKVPKIESELNNINTENGKMQEGYKSMFDKIEEQKKDIAHQNKLMRSLMYLIFTFASAIFFLHLDKLNQLKNDLQQNKDFDFLGKISDVLGLFVLCITVFRAVQLYHRKPTN